jgi:hypothetical protein
MQIRFSAPMAENLPINSQRIVGFYADTRRLVIYDVNTGTT